MNIGVKEELCLPALKSYKLSMKNCWTWSGKFSKYSQAVSFLICFSRHFGNVAMDETHSEWRTLLSFQYRVPIMLVGNKNDLHMERYVTILNLNNLMSQDAYRTKLSHSLSQFITVLQLHSGCYYLRHRCEDGSYYFRSEPLNIQYLP